MARPLAYVAVLGFLAASTALGQGPGAETGRYAPPPDAGGQSIYRAPIQPMHQPMGPDQARPMNPPAQDATDDSWLGLPRQIMAKAERWQPGERIDSRYAPSFYRRNTPSPYPPAVLRGNPDYVPEVRARRTWRDEMSRFFLPFF
ncbi:MAG: hypothetical protein HYS13_06405 [Planctomycetia bacterium]|nr:hypothetical protein [Planctomycetia bacterium]